jgi:Spy/CpxP family protein refolding chaperone
MTRLLFAAIGLALTAAGAAAQHDHRQSPYADLKGREIKALSPEMIAEYETGEGMGLALAAELNRYPGPRHVLELATELDLAPEQVLRVEAVRDTMQGRAVALGGRIVELERAMDAAFAGRTIDERELERATAEIGRLQGELRFVHLRAHLAMAEILTPPQIDHYEMLRGYAQHEGGSGGG